MGNWVFNRASDLLSSYVLLQRVRFIITFEWTYVVTNRFRCCVVIFVVTEWLTSWRHSHLFIFTTNQFKIAARLLIIHCLPLKNITSIISKL
ncbi:hypothetical protein JHK82_036217 [Glycine max]|uniref:Uncharacterized protein n=1 Tax=Glycine max TaxID=3847 RepID=A0A0R0GVG4_SOYBN|nr:hypothetical protein JHK87_036139 [Glycine soja]KAG4970529.1 hypothetical protein JHK85_036950 [Glycine max]KAG4976932.1 hypothetical protein JHK86_036406 [Glycine max]KAG5112948.1 hypothetical protein JHK82_036217 [Glycine max]KAG5130228.1 hypothetical protein JHK84_036625 [Glycine max]